MPDELESKVRVAGHEPVRAKLRAAGAQYEGRVLETNRLFDDEQATLFHAGCGLRVRECKTLDGPDRPASLTYKGPQRDSAYKRRTEIEVHIEDAAAMTEILGALGFSERLCFEKKRESWKMGECRVELDELPELGLFVEVEGPSEDAVQSALAWLGLGECEQVRDTYAALLAEDRPVRPMIVRFVE